MPALIQYYSQTNEEVFNWDDFIESTKYEINDNAIVVEIDELSKNEGMILNNVYS